MHEMNDACVRSITGHMIGVSAALVLACLLGPPHLPQPTEFMEMVCKVYPPSTGFFNATFAGPDQYSSDVDDAVNPAPSGTTDPQECNDPILVFERNKLSTLLKFHAAAPSMDWPSCDHRTLRNLSTAI